MSVDSARNFIKRLQTDADFRQDLLTATRDYGHLGRSKFIAEKGFEFSVKDLDAAKQDYVGRVPKDLSAIVDFISCGMIIHDPPSTRVA
ncbi:MAG: Nif11-like leader peptide family natural product precursor [Proteobacteria bacterium]|nr:Nif11-like leader peptide family natural product precursor [Pseudomonadota bacterium]